MKRIVFIYLLTFFMLPAYAQQTITGVVKNQKGEPLAGANVTIKETYRGTATNTNGEFKLSKLKPERYTFIISYIGYKTLRISLRLRNLNI